MSIFSTKTRINIVGLIIYIITPFILAYVLDNIYKIYIFIIEYNNIRDDVISYPYIVDKSIFIDSISSQEMPFNKITNVYFYGAGCSNNEKKIFIKDNLSIFFKNATIEVRHDLEAACFALFNGIPNITCILGTGSNSCFFNGKDIVEGAPSLGFIVGDEASGSYFGKKIANSES